MRIDIFDVDKFIEVNGLEEITSPVHFDRGHVPNEDGCFSTRIFGRVGSPERKDSFGYIDLHGHVFHPFIHRLVVKLDRKIEDCIQGTKLFVIRKGKLEVTEDEAIGRNGLPFLYENWEKIRWERRESPKRKEMLKLLASLKKSEIFCSKWLVIPPFYRDVNYQNVERGKLGHDKINIYYSKLIRLAKSLKESESFGFSFMQTITYANIQSVLDEIFTYFISRIEKKRGLLQKNILGKSTDWSGRAVISAPHINTNHYKEVKVNFEYSGVPVAHLICLFFPFIIKFVQDLFKRQFFALPKLGDYVLKEPMNDFSYAKIKKAIDRYYNTPSKRFEIIHANTDKGYQPIEFTITKFEDNKEPYTITRPLTWTDIFYIAAKEVCKDKHVYLTRYPVTDFLSIYPSKITVLSTFRTEHIQWKSFEYEDYPVIDFNIPPEDIATQFIDSLQVGTQLLPAIGGDFDGDMLTIRGVYSQEANLEAARMIKSPRNILNIAGKTVRTISAEGVQTFYSMTCE